DYATHCRDRAPTVLPAAAVCSDAAHLDLDPDESLVRDDQPALARLRHDTRVARVAAHEIGSADARVFFVAHECGVYRPARRTLRELLQRRHDRCDAALHVIRAAAVELPVLDARLESVLDHAFDGDRVEVRTQRETRTVATTDARDRVAPPRRDLIDPRVDPAPLHPVDAELRDFAFAAGGGDEGGVLGVDAYEVEEERGEVHDGNGV